VLVAGGDELEEQVRGVLLERELADLVDDDEAVSAQLGQFLRQAPVAVGVGQAGDPVGGRREQHPVPVLGGDDAQRGSEVGLAGSGRAEHHDVAKATYRHLRSRHRHRSVANLPRVRKPPQISALSEAAGQ
jgi:hypothetical protein